MTVGVNAEHAATSRCFHHTRRNLTGFHNAKLLHGTSKKKTKTYNTFKFPKTFVVGEIAAAFTRSAICRTHAGGFKLAALVRVSGEGERRRRR